MQHRPSRRVSVPALIVFCLLALALVVLVAVRAVSVNNAESAETLAPAASETPVPPTSGPELTPEPSAAPTAEPTATPEPTPEPSPEYFTVSMVGDCTLAEAKTRRGWGTALQTVVGKNYDYPFAKTVQYFEKDYLTIANLECNLSDKYYDSIEQFVFLAPADYANILTAGSVEFVTLANNHTMDFGQSAYDDTAAALDAVGVAYAGEDETYIYEKDGGVKVGIYCLYNQLTYNAMSILSAQAQEKLVAASRDKIAAGLRSLEEAGADFTIACLHMGREGYYEPTDVQTELCRYTVDAGFNAVYCTHAHRLQPAEDYNGGVIFYGLGNFIFGGHTNPGNGTDPGAYDTGIAQLTLKRVGGEVTLDSYSFIPCSLSSTVGPDSTVLGPNTLNNYQPQPYTEGGDAWNRAMSMLNGTYEGANYQVDYGNVLTAMNG